MERITFAPQATKIAPRKRPAAASTVRTFEAPRQFIPSGSFLMDCVLGGGYGCGRIVNIVGDKSTGKTLCAIEACANFIRIAPVANIRYIEAEAAYDVEYGRAMGMPPEVIPVDTIRTVEAFENDLDDFLAGQKRNQYPCLYVLDSLDALSDSAEMERANDKGSYGSAKAKKLSELFRKRIRDLAEANCTLMIISQIRDKLNVMFGETKTRSGGHALNFYASQVVWLVETGKIKHTAFNVERVTGLNVLIRNRKNKVGAPLREAATILLLGYGFDDETSMVKWLMKCKAITNGKQWEAAIENARVAKDRANLAEINRQLREMVRERWQAVDTELAPAMSEYDV